MRTEVLNENEEIKEEVNVNGINENKGVMESVLKLMRAVRRKPVRPADEFPPAIKRALWIIRERGEGITAAELCEALDVRPSSMSELLSRMEDRYLIRREEDEKDKRAVRILLSGTGKEAAERMEASIREERERFSGCFTEEEAETFALLCDKLSAHLEEHSGEAGEEGVFRHRGGHHGGFGRGRHHGPLGRTFRRRIFFR